MKKACVLLAEGFEEVEAITPVDFLRRAGIEVSLLGLGGLEVKGAHGVRVLAEAQLEKLAPEALFDAVVIPGGMPGATNLAKSEAVKALILRHFEKGKTVAAICASPAVVLHGACGILKGKRFTGYPGSEEMVTGARYAAEKVVVDGNLITSRGPGTAGDFALAIIEALAGKAKADQIAAGTLLR